MTRCLGEMLDSPLMLNIVNLAYAGERVLHLQVNGTLEEHRNCLFAGVRSRQCQGFPRNPGRFHPGSGLSPSLDQLGAIEREASFL